MRLNRGEALNLFPRLYIFFEPYSKGGHIYHKQRRDQYVFAVSIFSGTSCFCRVFAASRRVDPKNPPRMTRRDLVFGERAWFEPGWFVRKILHPFPSRWSLKTAWLTSTKLLDVSGIYKKLHVRFVGFLNLLGIWIPLHRLLEILPGFPV